MRDGDTEPVGGALHSSLFVPNGCRVLTVDLVGDVLYFRFRSIESVIRDTVTHAIAKCSCLLISTHNKHPTRRYISHFRER